MNRGDWPNFEPGEAVEPYMQAFLGPGGFDKHAVFGLI
jgi:hypothetical protein